MKDEWNRSQQIYFLKLHFQVHSMYENSVIKMTLMWIISKKEVHLNDISCFDAVSNSQIFEAENTKKLQNMLASL